MEQNPSPEIRLQQEPNVQQPSQTLPQYHSPNTEAPDMMIENIDSKDVSNMSLSQLLKICQFKKALSLLEAEFDAKQASLGESHIELVPLLNRMADIQISRAQYSKASELCQRSEQILQNYQENTDFSSFMAHTFQNMAVISRENNNKTEALALINKSLTLSPPESLQNIEIHRIKALVLCDFQQYKEAQQEIQKSIDVLDKSTNPIDKVRVYNTMGEMCSANDDWDQAKIVYESALKFGKEHELNSHVEMAKVYEGLGYSLIETKRLSFIAVSFGKSALDVYDGCFGEDRHPARTSCFLLFAKFHYFLQSSLATAYILKAIEEGEAFYGSDCEKMREIRLSAAKVSRDRKIKEDLVKPILETSKENKSDRELVNLYIQKCEASLLCEDFDFFESLYPEAENVIRRIYGDVSLEMIELYKKVTTFHQAKRQPLEMLKCIMRYGEIYKAIFGGNHIEIAKACLMIAKICIGRSDYGHAIPYLEKTLVIQREFYGEVHPAFRETLSLSATCYVNSEESLKAIKIYYKVLEIQEKLEDDNINETYEAIGLLYSSFNDTKNARSYLKKSYQMSRVKLGMNDERTLETKDYCEFSASDKDLIYDHQRDNKFL